VGEFHTDRERNGCLDGARADRMRVLDDAVMPTLILNRIFGILTSTMYSAAFYAGPACMIKKDAIACLNVSKVDENTF